MKRTLTLALTLSLSLGVAAIASAAPSDSYQPGMAANGMGNSRHNLGSFGEHDTTSATTEICVFCHTPHHTNAAASDYRPLWNRATPTGFTAYGTTIGGTTITSIGGGSLACLSCHDGVTTLDNLVNAPGRDGWVAGGRAMGWQFYDDGIASQVSPVITITGTRHNIGQDLTNDHPMSVAYDATKASLRPESTVISSIDLKGDLMASALTFDAGNLTRNYWAVKGFISNTATISDLLRGGKVECASCHDPHFSNKTGASPDQGYDNNGLALSPATDTSAASWDGLFLRRVGGNVGSGVCRTCHNK